MNPQADVVKKSCLKLKVTRSKSGSSSAVQGPKVFKEFWFVFRALDGGDKILEYHQNERKFKESPAYPKGVLHLGSALAVSYHNPEKKQQFSVEMVDGSICFFEAASSQMAQDWVSCLNAVLFGKGTGPDGALQYFVEATEASRLHHVGPCMLEVRGEDLIVKTKEGTANLVRWKLAHIRSFKAKKDTLTVYSGSRSSTGVGEYYFRSAQSVQITHAIETVVKRLKYEALGMHQETLIPQHALSPSISAPAPAWSRQFNSERRRPLPPPPPPSHPPPPSPTPTPPHTPAASSSSSDMSRIPDHIPDELLEFSGHSRKRLSSDTIKNIPSYCPPEYSVISELKEQEGYQRLDRTHQGTFRHSLSPKDQSPPPEGYSRLHRSPRSSPVLQPRGSASPQTNRSPSPSLPASDHSGGRKEEPVGDGREQYGRLDHRVGGALGPDRLMSEEGYSKLERKPSPAARKRQPPAHSVSCPVDSSRSEASQTYSTLGPPPVPEHNRGQREQPVQDSAEPYGRLEHRVGSSHGPDKSAPDEGYGKLEKKPSPAMRRKPPPTCPAPYHAKEGSTMPAFIQAMNQPPQDGGDYATLDNPVPPEDAYSRLRPGPPSAPSLSASAEGYGQLSHSGPQPGTGDSHTQNHTPFPSASAVAHSREEYSRLRESGRPHSTFDPYGSLSETRIEELSQLRAPRHRSPDLSDGDYSRLTKSKPARPSHEVDSKGYSRPWTSFNLVPAPVASKPAPAVNGHTHNPGAQVKANHTVAGGPFEELYEPVSGSSEGSPPLPPPRAGSRFSPSLSERRARGSKPLPPPKPHIDLR